MIRARKFSLAVAVLAASVYLSPIAKAMAPCMAPGITIGNNCVEVCVSSGKSRESCVEQCANQPVPMLQCRLPVPKPPSTLPSQRGR